MSLNRVCRTGNSKALVTPISVATARYALTLSTPERLINASHTGKGRQHQVDDDQHGQPR